MSELFEHVRQPSEQEAKVIKLLGYAVQQPAEGEQASIVFISKSLSKLETTYEGDHKDSATTGVAANTPTAERAVSERKGAVSDVGENVARLTPKAKDRA